MISIAPDIDEIVATGFLEMRFQPIVRIVGGRVILSAVEALVRGPEGSLFERPALICDFVRRKRKESRFDRECVRLALGQASLLPRDTRMNVNVHAATLHHDDAFVDFLREEARTHAYPLDRLTIEIVEHAPNWADYRLDNALRRLREFGVRLALDDIGAGHASFRMILDIKPDVFKVDRYFLQDCAADPGRLAVLAAIVELAHRFDAEIVGEGVERKCDLAAAQFVGIASYQGHLFARALPARALADSGFERSLESYCVED